MPFVLTVFSLAQKNNKGQSSLLSYFSSSPSSKKKRLNDTPLEGVVLEHKPKPDVENVSGSSSAQPTTTINDITLTVEVT